MRSDPRHLAVIPHHGGDGDNPPGPGPATPVIPSLSRSLFLSQHSVSRPPPFLSPSRSFLSSLLLRRVFCLPSPSGIVPLVSAALPRGLSPPSVSLSLTRKLADPISTKLHCVSYLHAVASIYSVRNCTLPSPFPFTSRCIQYFTSICGAAHLPPIPHSPRGNEKKSAVSTVAFRVSA